MTNPPPSAMPTLVTLTERYPTSRALDEALEGSATALPEQFAQLDELLVTLAK